LHFQEQGRFNPAAPGDRLPASVYGTALDHLVIACTDLVFTYKNRVLLAQRDRPPRASWWIIGGRMAAGEAPIAAALRKASEEAQLHLSDDRLRYIGVYSTCFATRHQPPQQNGLHSLNVTYHIELTETEQAAIVLDSEEYSDWRWVENGEIASMLASDEAKNDAMDQALLQVIRDLGCLFS
jgi:8-oxo-dGTP pyrophosphatase MutT (NUDIX family)